MLWIARVEERGGIARGEGQPAPLPIQQPSCDGGEGSGTVAGGGREEGGGRAEVCADEGTAASGSLSGILSSLTLRERGELEKLRSYDPCLMLLLEWMTEPDQANRADMMDVLRHP